MRATSPPYHSPDGAKANSDVEPEVHYVAVAHDVVLSFQPQLARFFRALLASARDVVAVRDHLGADKAALEVGVDDARRLRRGGADLHGPRAHFLRPGGEEGLEPEQRVTGADQAIEARLLHSHVG